MHFLNNYKLNIINYDLLNKFFYKNSFRLPKIKRINLYFNIPNFENTTMLSALTALEIISSQKSKVINSRASNISLKIKKGSPIGCKINLSKTKKNYFLTKLLLELNKTEIPKIKKSKNSFVFSFQLKTILQFPELKYNYQYFNVLSKLNINIITTAASFPEYFFLLKSYKLINANVTQW